MQQLGKISDTEKRRKRTALISPVLLVPKAAISNPDNYRDTGRSSDLLHFFAAFPSIPIAIGTDSGNTGSKKHSRS